MYKYRSTLYSSRPNTASAGFGLVELLVSIGIMMLVTTAVLVRQSSFNSSVLLENQAYEVAFDVRQTQLQAVSAQSGTDDDFYSTYQITFTTNNRMYDVFRLNPDGSESRMGAPLQLDPRFRIAAIMADGVDIGNSASIRFLRPNFDATFVDSAGTERSANSLQLFVCPTSPTPAEAAEQAERILRMAVGLIPSDLRYDLNGDGVVTSSDALIAQSVGCVFRLVEVSNTGQISVK